MATTTRFDINTIDFEKYMGAEYFNVCTYIDKNDVKTFAYARPYLQSKHGKKLSSTDLLQILLTVKELSERLGYQKPKTRQASAKIRSQYKRFCIRNNLIFFG